MTTRKIWRNKTDWYSAESRDGAEKIMMGYYGYSSEDLERCSDDNLEYEPIPDDKILSVTFHEGYDDGREYPSWADVETMAKIERVKFGSREVYRVSAPAQVWAKNMFGMVCSTEF